MARSGSPAVAVYARAAADDDAGTACRRQIVETLDHLEEPERVAVYLDAARSGLKGDRPGLQRLLGEARRGLLRRVVVRDVSRLARSATLLEAILAEFRAAGVELVTTREKPGDA